MPARTPLTTLVDDDWAAKTALVSRDVSLQMSSWGGTLAQSRIRGEDPAPAESALKTYKIAKVIIEQARYAPLSQAEAAKVIDFVKMVTAK